MHFNAYGGNGAALAAALVNATDFSPGAVEAMLTEHQMLRTAVTAGQAEELRAWARRLDPVFGETDQDVQIKLVNDLLDVTASKPYVSAHDGREPHLHFFSVDADVVSRAKDTTAGGLAMAMSFAGGRRLGRCDREGCATVYVDTSRNGRRRFCSLACANRVNVAAHRARGTTR
ncbi:CGNR zinc finger domain-containing protein [Nonomuraea pusilla]|uniref:CGNR zinc finger domain-containing protein n=1 Tax=Nonomuraea pusilla TaxID=46177 RepID=A0A1H7XLD3_9ACTN|nr:CGNR zinc finger domain-containing protein [Nonomuraea pusilla]SEM34463.1 CGNR zinc finger domain-containing protein [Nonomuraea pusilla]